MRLEDGKAVVTLKLEEDSVPVYCDASVLLRPKTGLKDMVAELTPGTKEAGELEDGDRIPIGQTSPDVNLDEILAVLDGDTRSYLQLLLSDGARGLKGNGRELANTIRRFEPTARDTLLIAEQLARRRDNIKRAIHNFSLVVDELGAKDDELAEFVENSNAVFASLASQDANLRATLQELPSALTETKTALAKADTLAEELGPTLQALRPGARALGPALRQTRPFLRETTPIIRDEIRPFVRASRPLVKELRPAARDLAALDARPACARSRSSTRCSTRSPTTRPARPRRASSSGPRGSTTSGRRSSPTRTATARSAAASSCSAARPPQLLENVARGNPQLGVLVQLLETPARRRRVPDAGAADERGRERLMQKAAPSFGRIAVMVGVRAVVLRAAAVPVARVRRPDPAQAEGLPGQRLVPGGVAARVGGRRAHLRRAGRQGQDDRERPEDGPLDGDDRARGEVQPAAVGRARRCCARRRCWARPTSS